MAIAAVNRASTPASVKIPWRDLGIESAVVFKDVWNGLAVKAQSDSAFTIPPHGVVLLRSELPH